MLGGGWRGVLSYVQLIWEYFCGGLGHDFETIVGLRFKGPCGVQGIIRELLWEHCDICFGAWVIHMVILGLGGIPPSLYPPQASFLAL